MIIKEVGFRPVYHLVCAFELNDKLKEIIKDCPDAGKASHAVVYGYIDPKEGLMLEILGAGKQAPKYFYFKDPYEGEKITKHQRWKMSNLCIFLIWSRDFRRSLLRELRN